MGAGFTVPRHTRSRAPALVTVFIPSVLLEFTWRKIWNVAEHRKEHASEHLFDLEMEFYCVLQTDSEPLC